MIDILTLPILSILNTSYLTYLHKDEINKSENKSENKVQKYISIILTVLTILILSIFIEKGMGRLFQLLIIFICVFLISSENLQFQDKLFYFLGVFLIVQIYLIRNNYIRGFLIFLIISIIITLEFLEYKTNDSEKSIKYKSNLKNFLISSLITILILCWGEYGKEPNVKYIKLFSRK
jgi:hypothetical protein